MHLACLSLKFTKQILGLYEGQKAKKKLLPNDLELSNLARNQIKKISPEEDLY